MTDDEDVERVWRVDWALVIFPPVKKEASNGANYFGFAWARPELFLVCKTNECKIGPVSDESVLCIYKIRHYLRFPSYIEGTRIYEILYWKGDVMSNKYIQSGDLIFTNDENIPNSDIKIK